MMYEPEEDYMEEGDESEEISNEIWQEACWTVISAYFEEKGITVVKLGLKLEYREYVANNSII